VNHDAPIVSIEIVVRSPLAHIPLQLPEQALLFGEPRSRSSIATMDK
jgi:hypothetical protein